MTQGLTFSITSLEVYKEVKRLKNRSLSLGTRRRESPDRHNRRKGSVSDSRNSSGPETGKFPGTSFLERKLKEESPPRGTRTAGEETTMKPCGQRRSDSVPFPSQDLKSSILSNRLLTRNSPSSRPFYVSMTRSDVKFP